MGSRTDLVEPTSKAIAGDDQTPLVYAVTGSPRIQMRPITTITRHGFAPSPNDI